jgi:hypothetical protein
MIQHITPDELHQELMKIRAHVDKTYEEHGLTSIDESHKDGIWRSLNNYSLLINIYKATGETTGIKLSILAFYHEYVTIKTVPATIEKGKFRTKYPADYTLKVELGDKATTEWKELVYNTIIEHLHGTT